MDDDLFFDPAGSKEWLVSRATHYAACYGYQQGNVDWSSIFTGVSSILATILGNSQKSIKPTLYKQVLFLLSSYNNQINTTIPDITTIFRLLKGLRRSYIDLLGQSDLSPGNVEQVRESIDYFFDHVELFGYDHFREIYVADTKVAGSFASPSSASDREKSYHRVISTINEMILEDNDLQTILNYICNQMVESLHFAGGWIGIRMADGSVNLRAASDSVRESLEKLQIRWDLSPNGFGPAGRAIRSGRIQIQEVEGNPAFDPWREFFETKGLLSIATLPLRVQGDIIGVITFFSRQAHQFTNDNLVEELERFAEGVELAIKSSESRRFLEMYRLLAQYSPDIFIYLDPSGQILDANHAAVEAYGLCREELVGLNIRDLRAPDNSADVEGQFSLVQGEGIQFQSAHRGKDGRIFPVEVSSRGVLLNGEKMILSVIRDVTERHKWQRILFEEREQLRVTLASIGDAVIATDTQSIVTFINPVAEYLTGYTYAEAIGKPIDVIFRIANEETGGPVEIPISRVLRTGKVVGLANHTILISREGTVFPIADAAAPIRDSAGSIAGVVVIFRDDTERKQSEREILDANRRLTDIINFLPDATLAIDANGIVIAWNRAIEMMTGISSQDMIGKGNYEYALPFYGERRPLLVDFALKCDESMQREHLSIFYRNGDVLFAEGEPSVHAHSFNETYLWGAASVLRNARGEVTGAIETIRDITSHKLLEAGLTKAKEDADRANRAKDDFLAKISHEIRTPLSSILGMSEMLADTALTSEQSDYVFALQDSSSLLLGIINDILDFSRIQEGKIGLENISFQILPVIDSIIRIVGQKARDKGLEIMSLVDDHLPMVLCGDPVRLRQILLNLAFNAVKFTEKGEIRVSAVVQDEEDGWLTVRFEVIDTGVGVPEEERQKIFLPFVQGQGAYVPPVRGTGLGLSIASWLVTQMGGEIGVESEVGTGSKFWFTVRLQRGTIGQTSADRTGMTDSVSVPSLNRGVGLVLLAEDNPVNREMTLLQLQKMGFSARAVANGREAVDAALTGDYTVVLMDLQMPVLDGFESIRIIREQEKVLERHIPIIALTAHALPGYRERCLAAGADDYLTKPVRRQDLHRALTTWIQPGDGPKELSNSTSASTRSPEEVIDTGVLLELLGTEEEESLKVFEELFDIFTSDTLQRLAKLRQALAMDDAHALWETAHSLKSGSAAVGASSLAKVARELESLGRLGLTGHAEALVSRAEEEFTMACLALKGTFGRGEP